MGPGAAVRRRTVVASSLLPLLTLAGCERARDASAGRQHIEGGFVGTDMARGHALRDSTAWPAPARVHRNRVLIAGGGVAGLAAARALRLRGIDDFALLELEDSAGGNSRGGSTGGIACPLGAHYLPVPGNAAADVQDLLVDLGLAQRGAGGWRLNARGETHLCHSPQERLFFNGEWQSGLLPVEGIGAATLAQYQAFERVLTGVQQASAGAFTIPASKHPLAPIDIALDAITFEVWLSQNGLVDAHLRWYLDYCCRDDYGAGIDSVSAWAGIHYFASRHGFHAPQAGADEAAAGPSGLAGGHEAGVLTWPEGNGWLVDRLATPLGSRLRTGCTVVRISERRQGVEIDAFNAGTQQMERWQVDRCIVALPLFIAARVLETPPAALRAAAARLRYAPWLVANLQLDAPLLDRPGAPPAWDNVIYPDAAPKPADPASPTTRANRTMADASTAAGRSAGGLGYVDARHQSLSQLPGPTVLTYYRSFGLDPAGRAALYGQPWSHWRDAALADLSLPHPDLADKTRRIDIVRYGHAMAVPEPGVRSDPALAALQQTGRRQRLHFAHSDLSGYSVFEEAFSHGHRAGMAVG